MPSWRGALSWQTALVHACWVGTRLMFGYRALADGADPIFLAWMASVFALPALIGALPAGRFSDRYGGARIAIAGLLITFSGTAAALVIPGLGILLVASAAGGLGHMLAMVGLQTLAAHASAPGERDRAFGTLTAAASVGQLVGAPLTTALATWGVGPSGGGAALNTASGLIGCLVFVVLGLLAYFPLQAGDRYRARHRRAEHATKVLLSSILAIPGVWYSVAVSSVVLVTVDLLYAFIPVWAIERDIDATTVGLLLALRALVSTVCRIGLGRMVAKFGRRALLITSIVAGAAALIALPFIDEWWAILAMIAIGLCIGLPTPLTMAWVTSITPRSAHGAVLGLRLTSNRLAQVSLPLMVGLIAAPVGVIGIFWANAALLFGVSVVAAIAPNAPAPDKQTP